MLHNRLFKAAGLCYSQVRVLRCCVANVMSRCITGHATFAAHSGAACLCGYITPLGLLNWQPCLLSVCSPMGGRTLTVRGNKWQSLMRNELKLKNRAEQKKNKEGSRNQEKEVDEEVDPASSHSSMTDTTSWAIEQCMAAMAKRRNSKRHMYIVSDLAAECMSRHLSSVLSEQSSGVSTVCVEVSSGPGVLTRRLISCCQAWPAVTLRCAELDSHFIAILKESCADVSVYEGSMLSVLRELMTCVSPRSTTPSGLFGDLISPHSDEWSVCIVGVAHCMSVFYVLLRAVTDNSSLMSRGRLQLLLFIPPVFMKMLEADHTTSGLLAQIMLDLSIVDHMPLSCFYPQYRSHKGTGDMLLVRVSVKQLALSQIDVVNLGVFVRYCNRSRRAPLMSLLEDWAPGCGPHMVAHGLDVFTPFCRLSAARIVQIYCDLIASGQVSTHRLNEAMQNRRFSAYERELHPAKMSVCGEETHELRPEELSSQMLAVPHKNDHEEHDNLTQAESEDIEDALDDDDNKDENDDDNKDENDDDNKDENDDYLSTVEDEESLSQSPSN